MRTTRQQQQAEARVWLRSAEMMATKDYPFGLCTTLQGVTITVKRRIRKCIWTAVSDVDRHRAYFRYILAPVVSGPDWNRCLFACLMAAVAEAGDMEDFR